MPIENIQLVQITSGMNNIRIIKSKDDAWPVTKPLQYTTTIISNEWKAVVLHSICPYFCFIV